MAANSNNAATFSQEPHIYPHDVQEPKIWKDAWIHEFVKFPEKEVQTIEATVCKNPAPQSFPSLEEQPYGKGEIIDGESSKRRKKIRKAEKGPIYVFKTRSETNIVEDGYKWRKYGTKMLKSKPHPRSYYRCSDCNCSVKKKVEREASDPGLLITTYEGTHSHENHSVIYYIGNPIILPQPPGLKPAIVLVNAGVCSEAGIKFSTQQAF